MANDQQRQSFPQSNKLEQRAHARVERVERALIETYTGSTNNGVGITVSAKTTNVSVTGFQVKLTEPLKVGSILNTCIAVTDHQARYWLIAEVRWCGRNYPAKGYTAGFCIIPGEGSDYQRWLEAFAGIDQHARRA